MPSDLNQVRSSACRMGQLQLHFHAGFVTWGMTRVSGGDHVHVMMLTQPAEVLVQLLHTFLV